MKKCNNTKCLKKGQDLPLNNFSKNKSNEDGLSNRCKECVKASVKQSYNKNQDYYKEYGRKSSHEYRKNNPEFVKENRKKFNELYKEKGYWKEYYQNNKERLIEYSKLPNISKRRNERWKERYKNDINFKLKVIMQANFHLFFKDQGKNKNLSFSKIIGYNYNELKIHLENNFREGMTWDNLGSIWEIHHIKPQSMFNSLIKEDVKECWGLKNLIPLWKTTQIAEDNKDYNILGNRNVPKNIIYKP